MTDDAAVEERVARPPVRPVDELVEDDELAGRHVLPEGAGGARSDHAGDAEGPQRPHVRPEVDGVGRELVVDAVPGQEGDPAPGDGADGDRRRRRAVRGVDRDRDDVVEELVEAGAPEDPDLDVVGPGQEAAALPDDEAGDGDEDDDSAFFSGFVSDFVSLLPSDDEDDDVEEDDLPRLSVL